MFPTSVLTVRTTDASCFAGLGKTTPDPSASITLDGVEVPLGTGIPSGVNDTCLLYNEYPFPRGCRGCPGAVVTYAHPASWLQADWSPSVHALRAPALGETAWSLGCDPHAGGSAGSTVTHVLLDAPPPDTLSMTSLR